jgi:transcriptional regulator with XRE-family HTH domain
MIAIKERRIKKGMTQQQLADDCGITLRTIQRIENGEVKPSLYSLNTISRVLEADRSSFVEQSASKPYEFNVNFKINDMNQFLTDLKILVKSHWKVIVLIVLAFWLASSYTDIKAGIMDGWNGK